MLSKSSLLVLSSFALTSVVIFNAYQLKKQFYPSVVYLTKSSPSLAVLYAQALVLVLLFGQFCRKVFFGSLRAAEFEHLVERSWYAVTETCLAFTVFRDDWSPRFLAMFTVLLFIKVFHWLIEDRVDFMERSPNLSRVFHFRVLSLLLILHLLDSHFLTKAYTSTITKGASVQLVFGFEYAVLMVSAFAILFRYFLHCYDTMSQHPWEEKAVFMLYCDLFIGFIKVVLFSLFIAIMVRVHTFPLFAIRPMYISIRFFKKSLNDVIMSRRAINNMNTLYPDATEEELASGDSTCIICREEMTAGGCKKLPCSHIFHKACLRSWFQRQQSCPTCRLDVLRAGQNAARQRTPAQERPAQPNQPDNNNPWNAFMQDPNFAGMFGGMMPGFPAPGANAGGQPNVGNAQPNGAPPQATSPNQPSSSQANENAAGNFPAAGFDPSMFSMPFMPPMSAMPGTEPWMFAPSPPSDLGGLSEEELKQLEQSGRAGLEARVRCLKDINTLLDAAVLQMQQYTQVFERTYASNNPGVNSNQETGTTSSNSTDSSTSSKPESKANTNSNAGGPKNLNIDSSLNTGGESSSQSSGEAASPSTTDVPKTARDGAASGSTSTVSRQESDNSSPATRQESPEVAEIRRRRLERLEQRDNDDLD